MARYNIWMEGYQDSEVATPASLIAKDVEGETFDEAVLNWVSQNIREAVEMDVHMKVEKRYLPYNKYTNPIKTDFWGCRVFPTEEEARKSFG